MGIFDFFKRKNHPQIINDELSDNKTLCEHIIQQNIKNQDHEDTSTNDVSGAISVNIATSQPQIYNEILPTGNTFEEQMKIDLQKAIDAKENSPNPKFHRTEREEELSFQFSINHEDYIDKYENEIYVPDTKHLSIDDEIKILKKSVSAYNQLKKYCYKTKGGTIYFQDTWEYCYNSSNSCYSFIEPIQERLDFLINHYDTLKNLESIIIEKIQNTPGLLQKNIYELIDNELKSVIQSKIRDMEQQDKIKRTKKSGSYLLEIPKAL